MIHRGYGGGSGGYGGGYQRPLTFRERAHRGSKVSHSRELHETGFSGRARGHTIGSGKSGNRGHGSKGAKPAYGKRHNPGESLRGMVIGSHGKNDGNRRGDKKEGKDNKSQWGKEDGRKRENCEDRSEHKKGKKPKNHEGEENHDHDKGKLQWGKDHRQDRHDGKHEKKQEGGKWGKPTAIAAAGAAAVAGAASESKAWQGQKQEQTQTVSVESPREGGGGAVCPPTGAGPSNNNFLSCGPGFGGSPWGGEGFGGYQPPPPSPYYPSGEGGNYFAGYTYATTVAVFPETIYPEIRQATTQAMAQVMVSAPPEKTVEKTPPPKPEEEICGCERLKRNFPDGQKVLIFNPWRGLCKGELQHREVEISEKTIGDWIPVKLEFIESCRSYSSAKCKRIRCTRIYDALLSRHETRIYLSECQLLITGLNQKIWEKTLKKSRGKNAELILFKIKRR